MKGDEKLIGTLNALLAEELTAISQYIVHGEMADNWGYGKLHEHFEKQAKDEMKHAEKLIARILFLEGTPTVSQLNAVHIGADVHKQLQCDLAAEMAAVRNYNEAIHVADEVDDAATRTLLEEILRDEDNHVDWLEEQLDQIGQMGVAVYLSAKVRQ